MFLLDYIPLHKILVRNTLPVFYYQKVAGINMILCLMAREGDATRVRSEADDLGVCAKGELPGQA